MQNTKMVCFFTSKHESFGYYFKNNTFSKVNLPKENPLSLQNTSFDGKETGFVLLMALLARIYYKPFQRI